MDMDQEFDREQEQERDLTPGAPETPESPAVSPEIPETPPVPPEMPETPPVPPETPTRRGGRTRLLLGVAAVLVVLALVIVLAGRALAGGSVLQRSAKGLAANPTVAFLSDLCRQGTVSAELGLQELLGVEGTLSVESRSDYSDAEQPRSVMDLAVALKGTQLADLSVYADAAQLIFSSDALLPERGLGVDLQHLGENLDKSVFNPANGSAFALDQERFDALKNAVAADGNPELAALKTQGEALGDAALKMLGKTLKAHTERDKRSAELGFGDKSVKVNVHRYEADAEAIYEILLDTLEWAKDSQELRSFLDIAWADYLMPEGDDAIVGIYGVMGAGASTAPKGLPDDPNADNAQLYANFWRELDAAYTELKDGREEFLSENDGLELQLDAYISKGKGELLGVMFTVEQDRQKEKFEAYWGPSLAELNSFHFAFDDGYDEYGGSYTVEVNNKERFSAEMKLWENAHTVFEGSFQWNKSTGDFTLELGDFSLRGSLEALKDGYQAVVREMNANGSSQALELRLTLRSSAEVGMPPAYQDMTSMSEEEIRALLEDLQTAAYALLLKPDVSGLIYGLMP